MEMDNFNAEHDGTSGKPQPWRWMAVPGMGLQALTLQVCSFLGLHDATARLALLLHVLLLVSSQGQ